MSILEEASELINGDRARDYGPVTENFERIADLWMAYLSGRDRVITTYDVANMMILVKVSRLAHAGYHRDSYSDIAGYSALAERVNDEEATLPVELDESNVDLAVAALRALRDVPTDYLADWEMELLGVVEYPKVPKEPRVWDSLSDVPIVVEVTDADGDTWKHHFDKRWQCWEEGQSTPSDWVEPEDCGPFTEVVG